MEICNLWRKPVIFIEEEPETPAVTLEQLELMLNVFEHANIISFVEKFKTILPVVAEDQFLKVKYIPIVYRDVLVEISRQIEFFFLKLHPIAGKEIKNFTDKLSLLYCQNKDIFAEIQLLSVHKILNQDVLFVLEKHIECYGPKLRFFKIRQQYDFNTEQQYHLCLDLMTEKLFGIVNLPSKLESL